ncbi:hypothetical protein [Micromonospora costi]|uniref:hypothetical protein n=1 Tax=Micromonospora costi TaxID=1530042 RepID=UPI001F4E948F|nr:hypothetical protein [Micromonospora costi]
MRSHSGRPKVIDDDSLTVALALKGQHLATLGIYVRLGEEISARITAENDEHHRRHRC